MSDKIGSLVSRLKSKRDEIRAADEVVKGYKEEYNTLQMELLDVMKEVGVDKVSNDVATVSIKKTQVAQVIDWEKFYRYIHKNKAFFMLQKRVSDVAYRETLEDRKNRPIPGVESFTKVALNLRVL